VPLCAFCGLALVCKCGKAPVLLGTVTSPCPLKHGGIWVHVMDDDGTDVETIGITIDIKTKPTKPNGLSIFDPLDVKVHIVKLEALSPTMAKIFDPPVDKSEPVAVTAGQITYVGFTLTRRRMLKLTKVDPYFAPSKEDLDIVFEIANMAADTVLLRISSATGVLHERALTTTEKGDGAHTVHWDGTPDSLPGTFIDPLRGPYKVELVHAITAKHVDPLDHERPFNVLYHSLKLELGDWLPQREVLRLDSVMTAFQPDFTGANPADADVIKWTWCRLGQLGFFPGPLPGVRPVLSAGAAPDPLGHAIRRYRQADGDLYRRLFRLSVSGNGEGEIDGVAANVTAPAIDAPLLKKLWARTNGRLAAAGAMDVLEDLTVATGAANSKLFVDVDRFYVGYTAEFDGNAKPAVDAAWVPRPQLSLQTRLQLRKKNDTGVTPVHASALGDYRVKWSWTDRADNLTRLPAFAAPRPSRTQEYATLAIAAPLTAKTATHKNSPTAVGGLIGADDGANAVSCFAAHADSTSAGAVDGHLSGPPADPQYVDDTVLADASRVFFQPSSIGGDNYKLVARIDTTAWSVELSTAHRAVLPDLRKETGEFVVWRRVRFSAYVQWGAVSAAPNWGLVRAHLEKAYTTITDPVVSKTMAQVTVIGTLFKDAADLAYKNVNGPQFAGAFPPVGAYVQFANTHALPEDPRTLEFRDVSTIGVDQFAAPGNIVNELMMGLVRYELIVNREEYAIPRTKTLTDKRFKVRLDLATAWAARGDWVAAAGAHFQPELARLVGVDGRLLAVPIPANRRIRPIAEATLVGAPLTRAAILNDIFLTPLLPVLNWWLTGGKAIVAYSAFTAQIVAAIDDELLPMIAPGMGAIPLVGLADTYEGLVRTALAATPPPAPAAMTRRTQEAKVKTETLRVIAPGPLSTPDERYLALQELKTRAQTQKPLMDALPAISTAVKQLLDDMEMTDRNKYPVHGVLRQGLRHFQELLGDRIGKITGTSAASNCELKSHHMEVCVTDAVDAQNIIAALGAVNLAGVERTVPATPWRIIDITITGPFDGPALILFKTGLPAGAILTNLRGPGATIPAFAISVADDTFLDDLFRRNLVDREKMLVLQRLAQVYTVFNAGCFSLDDAVHALAEKPPGGFIACHYAAHIRPLSIAAGTTDDAPDFTNSTSIGCDGGVIFVSNDQPLTPDHLFAHEISHTLFLRHWQDAEEAIKPDWSAFTDHDLADNNCIMSYPAFARPLCHTHYALASYKPHFCGKCNLKLRGWDLAATHLPPSSVTLTPVFPNVAGLAVGLTQVPDPVDVHTQITGMAVDLGTVVKFKGQGTYTPAPDNLRFYGLTALAVTGGVSRFRRTPQAVTGLPSNTVFGPTAILWEHATPEGSVEIQDAQLLIGPNSTYKCAWEENLDQLIAQGGLTKAPDYLAFSMPTPRYYDPSTIFHEMIHFYQLFDASNVQEGITDILACLVAVRFLKVNALLVQFEYGFNPSYLHVMQFAVDQLSPRLGVRGMADMYFTGKSDGLNAWLQPGLKAAEFHRLCLVGIDNYDMREASAALRPIASRQPLTGDGGVPAVIDTDYAEALRQMQVYITATLPPSGAVMGNREQNVVLIRLHTKIGVFRDALLKAKAYRPQRTPLNRIHRLETYIEETAANLVTLKKEYVRAGGTLGDVDQPGDVG